MPKTWPRWPSRRLVAAGRRHPRSAGHLRPARPGGPRPARPSAGSMPPRPNCRRAGRAGPGQPGGDLPATCTTYLEGIEFNPRRLEADRRAPGPDPQAEAQIRRQHRGGPGVCRRRPPAAGNHHPRQRAHRRAGAGRAAPAPRSWPSAGRRSPSSGKPGGAELARAVEAELNDLRMAGARFAVDLQTSRPGRRPLEDGERAGLRRDRHRPG